MVFKQTAPQLCSLLFCCFMWGNFLFCPSLSMSQTTLLKAVDLALNQSDMSKNIQDSMVLSRMDISVAEHKFTTKLVPLTSIGVVQGTGSQQLGMEFQKNTPTGTSLQYGVVANRLDDNGDYAVTNPNNTRAFVRLTQGFLRRWGTAYNLTELNVAELRAEEKKIETERSRQGLIQNAVQSYYDLVLAKELYQKAQQSLSRSLENLASARDRQAVGLVSKVDVYRAELAVLNGKRFVADQKRALRRANNTLTELLRLDTSGEYVETEAITMMTPVIPENWEEELFNTRLDWRAHKVSLQINSLEMKKARRDLFPDIGLSFTLEQKGEGDSFSESIELDQTNWSVQLKMLSDLDSFDERNTLKRVRLDRARLKREKAALRRKIQTEVKEAFEDLAAEEQNHQINLEKLKQAKLALDLAQTRYDKGLSDNLDVIDAENAYSDAELDTDRSVTAYNLAAVTLAYKLGVLNRKWLEQSLPRGNNLAQTFIQAKGQPHVQR